MEWFAARREVLTSPSFIGADDETLGCWVRCHSYAAAQETPIIAGAKRWTDRAWLAAAQTTRAAVDKAVTVGLLAWRDDDLEILFYDHHGQERVEVCRANARKPPAEGRRPRGRPRTTEKPGGFPSANPTENPGQSDAKPDEKHVRSDPRRSEAKRGETYTQPSAEPSPASVSANEPTDFAAFWDAYLRKVARPRALRAWKAQRPPLAAVLADLARRRPTWITAEPRHIPHPATYLNDRRWEDVESAGPAVPRVASADRGQAAPDAPRDIVAGDVSL